MEPLVEVAVEYITETEAAILVLDPPDEIWIPKSLIEDMEMEDKLLILKIPEWFALKKGII